jgi:hypothetical protein
MDGRPFRHHPAIALAVTRISPAPAADQKQHYENYQDGLHIRTSLVGGSGNDLCNGRPTSSLCTY